MEKQQEEKIRRLEELIQECETRLEANDKILPFFRSDFESLFSEDFKNNDDLKKLYHELYESDSPVGEILDFLSKEFIVEFAYYGSPLIHAGEFFIWNSFARVILHDMRKLHKYRKSLQNARQHPSSTTFYELYPEFECADKWLDDFTVLTSSAIHKSKVKNEDGDIDNFCAINFNTIHIYAN